MLSPIRLPRREWLACCKACDAVCMPLSGQPCRLPIWHVQGLKQLHALDTFPLFTVLQPGSKVRRTGLGPVISSATSFRSLEDDLDGVSIWQGRGLVVKSAACCQVCLQASPHLPSTFLQLGQLPGETPLLAVWSLPSLSPLGALTLLFLSS